MNLHEDDRGCNMVISIVLESSSMSTETCLQLEDALGLCCRLHHDVLNEHVLSPQLMIIKQYRVLRSINLLFIRLHAQYNYVIDSVTSISVLA